MLRAALSELFNVLADIDRLVNTEGTTEVVEQLGGRGGAADGLPRLRVALVDVNDVLLVLLGEKPEKPSGASVVRLRG